MDRKHILCLLLTLCLLLCLFAGCAEQETATPAAPAEESASAETPAAPASEAPAESPAPGPAEVPAEAPPEAPTEPASPDQAPAPDQEFPAPPPEPGPEPEPAPEAAEPAPMESPWSLTQGVAEYDLPLFEAPLDLSIYWVQLGNQPPKTDLLFWDRVQENLGVNIEFRQISEMTNSEQYNLMIASGDMTDLIWEDNCAAFGSESAYPGGFDAAIDDEIYLELTDLLPEYAPNYWEILEHYPAAKKELTTDTGKLYSVSMIYSEPQGPRFGMLVRQDYMDDTGLPVPEDTDGWLEVMRAMKANGVVYPYGAQATADVAGVIDAFGTTATSVFNSGIRRQLSGASGLHRILPHPVFRGPGLSGFHQRHHFRQLHADRRHQRHLCRHGKQCGVLPEQLRYRGVCTGVALSHRIRGQRVHDRQL